MAKHSKGKNANLKHAWVAGAKGSVTMRCAHCGVNQTDKNSNDNCWVLVSKPVPGEELR